jgi:hypothetical protein
MLRCLNKLINGEIAIGFFVAGLFWMAAYGLLVSYTPTTAEKEYCYQAAAKSGHDTRECESFWEKTTSDPIALFTLILAFSTVGLWVATISLYRAGERQLKLAKETSDRQAIEIQDQIDITKISARAADESAKAAVATERARFYIVIQGHNIDLLLQTLGRYPNSPTMPLSFEPTIQYAFKNYGKTPGIIREVSHGLQVHSGPPDPVYTVSKHLFIENTIAAGQETEGQKFDGPVLFQTELAPEICTGR